MSTYDISQLKFLFNPKNIAIFGAGKDLNKVAGQVLLHLKLGNFEGNIFPINPKKETVFNIETIPRIKKISEQIDLAIMAIPRKNILPALEECVDENTRFIMILTAGYQETAHYDDDGLLLIQQYKNIIKNSETRIVGPNCMGIASTSSNLSALMGINLIPKSRDNLNMGFISQSGTWAAISLRCAVKHDLGVSKIVSTGNELDLTCEDFFEYLGLYDDTTQVIGAFIEQLRNGRKFIKICSEIEKPIVIIRAGKTEAGAKAALSHTGSISSSSRLYETVFKQVGIIEALSFSELMDYLRAFALFRAKNMMPKGNRVGIYTVGGGMGVITADICVEHGLDVINLTEKTIKKLNVILPPIWSHNNPVDLIATRDFTTTEKVLEILINAEEIDMIIPIVPFGIHHQMDKLKEIPNMPPKIDEFYQKMLYAYHKSIVDHLLKYVKISTKPIILTTSLYSTDLPQQAEDISTLFNAGICVVNNISDAAKIFSKLLYFNEFQKKKFS